MIIFAVVKFTEGAWLVLVLFAVLVPALIRMNREYTRRGRGPGDRIRQAAAAAAELHAADRLRLRRRLRPGHPGRAALRAEPAADHDPRRALRHRQRSGRASCGRSGPGPTAAWPWTSSTARTGGWPRPRADLVERELPDQGTHVTVILPRRSYSALLGRLLHDRTADKIAAVISRLPRSAATIVPYDVPSRVSVLQERQAAARKAAKAEPVETAAIGTAVPEPAGSSRGHRQAAVRRGGRRQQPRPGRVTGRTGGRGDRPARPPGRGPPRPPQPALASRRSAR